MSCVTLFHNSYYVGQKFLYLLNHTFTHRFCYKSHLAQSCKCFLKVICSIIVLNTERGGASGPRFRYWLRAFLVTPYNTATRHRAVVLETNLDDYPTSTLEPQIETISGGVPRVSYPPGHWFSGGNEFVWEEKVTYNIMIDRSEWLTEGKKILHNHWCYHDAFLVGQRERKVSSFHKVSLMIAHYYSFLYSVDQSLSYESISGKYPGTRQSKVSPV